jgi:glutamyl-tRNA reductase
MIFTIQWKRAAAALIIILCGVSLKKSNIMIAFIGMGLLGSNFVRAMLRKGDQVQVWNRTAAKAKALEADGAKAFDGVADAVNGAGRIHRTLK